MASEKFEYYVDGKDHDAGQKDKIAIDPPPQRVSQYKVYKDFAVKNPLILVGLGIAATGLVKSVRTSSRSAFNQMHFGMGFLLLTVVFTNIETISEIKARQEQELKTQQELSRRKEETRVKKLQTPPLTKEEQGQVLSMIQEKRMKRMQENSEKN